MKYCEAFAALLDPYLDGELSPEEMVRIHEHLDHCPVCRAYADDMLTIRAGFPGVEDTPVPVGFADAVCAAVRGGAAPRKKRAAPWAKALVPLAACLAVVILLQNGPLSMQCKNAALTAYDSAAVEECAPAEAAVESPTETGDSVGEAKAGRQVPTATQSPAASAPQAYAALSEDEAAPANSGAGVTSLNTGDAWVEHGNIVFSAVVFLTQAEAGNALDGYEGRPYSDADRPGDGAAGTGYALERTDFQRILDQLDASPAVTERQEATTDLCCIVVTDASSAVN